MFILENANAGETLETCNERTEVRLLTWYNLLKDLRTAGEASFSDSQRKTASLRHPLQTRSYFDVTDKKERLTQPISLGCRLEKCDLMPNDQCSSSRPYAA